MPWEIGNAEFRTAHFKEAQCKLYIDQRRQGEAMIGYKVTHNGRCRKGTMLGLGLSRPAL